MFARTSRAASKWPTLYIQREGESSTMEAVMPDYQKFMLCLGVLIFYLPTLYAQNTSCDIKSVRAGEAVSLTCQFSERLDVMKKDISIVHFNDTSEAIVAECYWPDCYAENTKGYIFNGTVADRLTLVLPNPSLNHEGRYECRYNGGKEGKYRPCCFHLLPDQKQQYSLEVVIPVTVAGVVLVLVLAVAAFAILRRQRAKSLSCQPNRADPPRNYLLP